MTPRRELDVDAVKRQVIELAKARYTPAEIVTMVSGGYRRRTLQKWIRESGEVPSNKALARAMWEEGAGAAEIASRLRIGKRGAYKLLMELRGKKRHRNTVDRNVQRFLADPENMKSKRFVRSEPFGRQLIYECVRISENPAGALKPIDNSVDLFTHLQSTARKLDAKKLAECRRVQTLGIKAHVFIRQRREREGINILLANLTARRGRCLACEADIRRRLGVAYGETCDWVKSEQAIEEAFACYSRLSKADHDLFGSGVGSCYLARSLLRLESIGSAAAIPDAEMGLRIVAPNGRSSALYGMLVFALAAAIARSGRPSSEDVAQARLLLGQASSLLNSATGLSVTRVKIRWLDGLLAALEGKESHAIWLLEDARDDAKELKAEKEAVALTADLARLDPNPRRVRAQIMDLWEAPASGRLYLPKWLQSEALRDALREAQAEALEAVRQSRRKLGDTVIQRLRDASGAGMPDLLGACA